MDSGIAQKTFCMELEEERSVQYMLAIFIMMLLINPKGEITKYIAILGNPRAGNYTPFCKKHNFTGEIILLLSFHLTVRFIFQLTLHI